MNVLHVSPAFYPALVYGGPMRALYDLCRALADAGESVRVLTTDANGAERVAAPAGQEVDLPTRGGASLRVLYARRRWRHTVSPELIRGLVARMRWAEVAHLTAVYSFPTLPTLLAVALVLGLMGWLGIQLDMATALVASVALGLSVDDTLRLYAGLLRARLHDIQLHRWVKGGVISKAWLGTGEEATTVGPVHALERGTDVVAPMIRNAAACCELGMPLAKDLDTHFRGRILSLLKVVKFALEVNYADFFGELQAAYGQLAVQRKAEESKSPSTST